jgi:hypothetical protein
MSLSFSPYSAKGFVIVRNSSGTWSIPSRSDNLGELTEVSCRPTAASAGNDDTCVIYSNSIINNESQATNALILNQYENTFTSLTLPVITNSPGQSLIKDLRFQCSSSTRCIASGYRMNGYDQPTTSYIGLWDGTTWTHLTSPNGPGNTFIYDLSCAGALCIGIGKGNSGWGMSPGSSETWSFQITDSTNPDYAWFPTTTTTTTTTIPPWTSSGPVTWIASPSPGYYDSLNSVSCVTASFCLAVGSTSTQS